MTQNIPTELNVLLIGGTGFIGRHLAQSCLDAGMFVRVVGTSQPCKTWSEMGIEHYQGDYGDFDFLNCAIDGMDMVVHLVHDQIQLSLDCNIMGEFERNIKPTIQLMDICCSRNIKKMLFVSSGGTVYGKTMSNYPISEDAATNPISLYGTTKLMIEKIGFLYKIQKNLPILVARPSNAYGPGQLPFRGQGFIATAMASALLRRPLNIYGDGSVIRDYIHVHDLSKAIVALLKAGEIGTVYNIGTEKGVSLRDLLDGYISPMVFNFGYKLETKYLPSRQVDVPCNVLKNSKIRMTTGFSPHIDLHDGLRDTFEWLQTTLINK